MGIDIYAKWSNQHEKAEVDQLKAWPSPVRGGNGYLREAYHGGPYATVALFWEAFGSSNEAEISASILKERLPYALKIAEERERKVYGVTDEAEIERLKESFRKFVNLCEEVEKRTGEPVCIVADY